MAKIYEMVEKNGVQFKIQQTGVNWTLYVKEKGKNKWEKIQSSVDAGVLSGILHNQKELKDDLEGISSF